MKQEAITISDDDHETELWENGTLGCDEKYARACSPEKEREIEKSLGFKVRRMRWWRKLKKKFN
jgi:hypothetical protein